MQKVLQHVLSSLSCLFILGFSTFLLIRSSIFPFEGSFCLLHKYRICVTNLWLEDKILCKLKSFFLCFSLYWALTYILTSTSYLQFRLLMLIWSLNCVFVCANCSVYRGVYWKETWIWYSWYHIFLWKDMRTNITHTERAVGFNLRVCLNPSFAFP